MAYDKDKPASSTSLRASNPEILANWDALETALNREHEFSTGGTTTDQAHHKKGSARCYFQDTAPTTRVDGTAFTSEDLGSLWFDSNSSPDNQFNVLTATTPTWTPVSTEIIAVMVAAIHTWAVVQTFSEIPIFTKGLYANNSFLVSRNAADNGNVDLIKADASDVPVVPDGTETATNAAPSSDKDLSNKKYVDDQVDTKNFSAYTSEDDEGQTILKDHAYLANSDGFITATVNFGGGDILILYIDDDSDPPSAALVSFQQEADAATSWKSVFAAVKSGQYFEITSTTGTPAIKWMSMGTLVKPTDNN